MKTIANGLILKGIDLSPIKENIVIDDEDLGKAPDDDADDDDADDNDDDNTTEDKDDGKDEVPDTGDDGTLYLWVLMLCALIGMAGVIYYEKLLGKKE